MGGCLAKHGEVTGAHSTTAVKPLPKQHASEHSKSGSTAAPLDSQKSMASDKEKGPRTDKPVLGKYMILQGKENIMGKGTSSICWKATDITTGKLVAVKIYRDQATGGKMKESTMQKYRRQISVLMELQSPWQIPADKTLWNDELNNISPSEVFMQLLDFSKNAKGEPSPDPEDGMLYVVSELAQYSLKDFLSDRREKKKSLSQNAVRDFSKRVILAMAALHAKGFVHVDMKPENLMVFDGRLKVIDVDGCVRIGTKISINDSSISFSPCYCSPEWARFIIKDANIIAKPGLDAWSVGMTICEFVTLEALWKAQYANFMKNATNPREAGFLFLEWLSDMKTVPLPRSVDLFDQGLLSVLRNGLLMVEQEKRLSCAQAMSQPYFAEGGWAKYGGSHKLAVEAEPTRRERDRRAQDESVGTPLMKGTLFKLNSNSDPKDLANWINRDMWLAQNFSLCYYSVKENKRLVLMDAERLSKAQIKDASRVAREFAFEISVSSDEDGPDQRILLAAENEMDLAAWKRHLEQVAHQGLMKTFKLGARMAEEVQQFKLAVRNRRMKVQDESDQFEPIYKDKVWKLKSNGDNKLETHWFQREMWVSKNGSMVYYSPKEERNLVYYTAADISRATISKVADGHACRNFVFLVQLAPTDGVEYDPGEFAAESEDQRERFVDALLRFAGPPSPREATGKSKAK